MPASVISKSGGVVVIYGGCEPKKKTYKRWLEASVFALWSNFLALGVLSVFKLDRDYVIWNTLVPNEV